MRIHVFQFVITSHKRFATFVAFVGFLAGMDSHVRPKMIVSAKPFVTERTSVGFLSGVYQAMAMQMLHATERPIAALAFVIFLTCVRPNVLGHFALAHPFATLRTAGRFRISRLQVLGEHRTDKECGGILCLEVVGRDRRRRNHNFVLYGGVQRVSSGGVRGIHGFLVWHMTSLVWRCNCKVVTLCIYFFYLLKIKTESTNVIDVLLKNV